MVNIERAIPATMSTTATISVANCGTEFGGPIPTVLERYTAPPERMALPAVISPDLRHTDTLGGFSPVVVFPLDGNGLAAFARLNASTSQGLHQCPCVDMQGLANLAVCLAFKDIKTLYGRFKRFTDAIRDSASILPPFVFCRANLRAAGGMTIKVAFLDYARLATDWARDCCSVSAAFMGAITRWILIAVPEGAEWSSTALADGIVVRHKNIPPVRDSCIPTAGAGPLQVTGFSDWLARPFLSRKRLYRNCAVGAS